MAIQSEAALENGLIATLRKMNYEYVQIVEEGNLMSNFKRQLEIHNKKQLAELGRTEFTEAEFEKIQIYLEGGTRFEKAKNFEIYFLWKQKTDNVFGWNFLTVSIGVRMSFRFPIKSRWKVAKNVVMM